MIKQSEFYSKVAEHGKIKAKFRQNGDIVEAGYLPSGSDGACLTTSLDFQRATSQGCQQQWIESASEAKSGSSIYQTLSGDKGTNFGRRQQTFYNTRNFGDQAISSDPLFNRGRPSYMPSEGIDKTKTNKFQQEIFESKSLASAIKSQVVLHKQTNLTLSFKLYEAPYKSGQEAGSHAIAFSSSEDGNKLFLMDPNAGVIETTPTQLEGVLKDMQRTLYGDFTLGEVNLAHQQTFWALPDNTVQKQDFQAEESSEHKRMGPEDYKQKKADVIKEQQKVPDNCDFDIDDEEIESKKGSLCAILNKDDWEDVEQNPPKISAALTSTGAEEMSGLLEAESGKAAHMELDEWALVDEPEQKLPVAKNDDKVEDKKDNEGDGDWCHIN